MMRDLLNRPRGMRPAYARIGKFGATPAADSRQLFIGEFAGAHRTRRHARQLASRQTSAIFRVAPCSNNIYRHLLFSFHSFLITGTETSLCSKKMGTGKEPCPRLRFRTSHADLLKRIRVVIQLAEAR